MIDEPNNSNNLAMFLTAPGPDNWTIEGQPMLYQPAVSADCNCRDCTDEEVCALGGLFFGLCVGASVLASVGLFAWLFF